MSDTELSPIKRALLEQRRLKARIQELERALAAPRAEPIAVIGLGCRFPGAENIAAFWRMLVAGVDAISELPRDRWNVDAVFDEDPEAPGKFATRFGGYLRDIDQFDAHRFGISPREAATMDPQQRLLLEVAWEALEHAGLAPDTLTGAPMGVFVGIGPNDYLQRIVQRGAMSDIDAYMATGNAHSVASGRISYLLGVHGPALSVDTACSSSLVATQLACESIRAGACETAIAGGVGVLLGEQNYVSLSKARMMAPDGRCKAFDSRADGFVRSEGCGIVVLKRLSAAQRDGDRVLAVIRGGAINQDGRSNGLTAPNGPAQQAVIRAAHENAGSAPSAVSYVEAHGTGTALGDPIEVESLAAVVGAGREASRPLYLGSVKTNIGHTEAAAGVAGLIKTVLALHHGVIPPNLHFQAPNPHIEWSELPFVRVPTSATPWESASAPRLAGVSAFGFSGTNAHLVLEEAPAAADAPAEIERPVHVLALSAKTEVALRAAAEALAAFTQGATTFSDGASADLCFSVNTGRAALEYRVAVTATNVGELRDRLVQLAAPGASMREPIGSDPLKVVFAFSHCGDATLRAAGILVATQPAFRAAVDACIAAAPVETVAALRDAFYGLPGDSPSSRAPRQHDAVAFATLYAAAAMWNAWGVRAAAAYADGIGELAALVAAGAMRLDDALASVSVGDRAARTVGRLEFPVHAAAERPNGAATIDLSVLEWDRLVQTLGAVFERGAAVDWRGFDRGYHRRRVDVPASPWFRERHWFDEATPPAAPAPPQGERWRAVTVSAARQATFVPADLQLSPFADLWRELDVFATAAIANAVAELGAFARGGARLTADAAAAAGGVAPAYAHLHGLWLRRLADAGILARDGGDFFAPIGGLRATATHLGERIEAVPVLRDYLRRCERQLVAIVSGRESPLDTLFPGGSFDVATFFHRDWSIARYYNAIVESLVEAALRTTRHRPMRVLEIGAGAGGTSSALAPLCAAVDAEYWITDISRHFLGRARDVYGDRPGVHFTHFDIDVAPEAQGIPAATFDIIVAADALHVARDLPSALDRIHALLAPGGFLVASEVTTRFGWYEMSVALVENWRAQGDELRAESPFLSATEWDHALRRGGFDHVASYPATGGTTSILGHHVIVAAKPASSDDRVSAAQKPASTRGVPASASAPIVAQPARAAKGSAPAAANPPAGALADRLRPLTYGEQIEVVRDIVQRRIIRVMRLRPTAPPPASTDRLMSIGMDSLMAVELRKQLEQELGGTTRLPSTLIFDHPTIAAIAELIVRSLGLSEKPTTDQVEAPAPMAAASSAIAAMSEAEVEAMLLEQLKGIES